MNWASRIMAVLDKMNDTWLCVDLDVSNKRTSPFCLRRKGFMSP